MSSEIHWIKITTDMFEDEKIRLIEKMPDGDTILVIWIKLLTLAGRVNAGGYILLTENIPYTDEMLSTLFDRPIMTVQLALQVFERFDMLHLDGESLVLTNWSKHQNAEALDKIREQTRNKVARYRERLQLVGGESYREHSNMVMARDNNRCVYCGSEENLVIDHLIPLLLGGDNEPDNLVASCRKCNSGKAGRLFEETGYTFLNPKTAEQYAKVKQRLEVTGAGDVTQRNLTEVEVEIEVDNKNKKKDKIIYGQFSNVLLTTDEAEALIKKFGIAGMDTKVQNLSEYIKSKGITRYKDHYATILNWSRRDGDTGKSLESPPVPAPQNEPIVKSLDAINEIFRKDLINERDAKFLGGFQLESNVGSGRNLYRVLQCLKGHAAVNASTRQAWTEELTKLGVEV